MAPSHVSLCLFMGFMTFLLAMNKSYSLPLPNRLFHSLVHHSWTFTYQPRTSFILHENLTPHHCLTLLTIILLCLAFSKIVCVSFMGLLGAIYCLRSNCKRDLPCSICERFQVHALHSRSYCYCERNLDNLATFTPHYHGL